MLLRTLGGLALPSSSLRRPKLLLLLAYLSVEGPQPRSTLATLFWPESPDAAVSLRVALHHLRAAVPDAVQEQEGRVCTPLDSDLTPLFGASRLALPREVERLYTGPFLDGLSGSWGTELEEWVYRTREYVAGLVRSSYLRAARRALDADQPSGGALLAAAALQVPGAAPAEAEDLQELYLLLTRAGHPAAAQARRLAAELGMTLRGERRSRSGALQAAPNETPGAASLLLVGRARELAELSALLRDGARLVTLVGAGGSGKSRLASTLLAERPAERRANTGVLRAFVPLEGVTDARLIASRICDALDLTPPLVSSALPFLVSSIGHRRGLLALDNFEQLGGSGGHQEVDALLTGCPNLQLLLTSREPLHHPEEQLYPLDGLDCGSASPQSTSPGSTSGAARLFVLRARRVRPDFALTERNAAAVQRICAAVGGSPLALELAAPWVRTLPVEDLASELERDLDLLGAAQEGRSRHASLRAVFTHSWELLGAREREVLRRVSVFVSGFTREAASRVAGATTPLLATLVDRSLLRLTAAGRYELHPLVAQYAAEQLTRGPQEREAARRAHARYFVQLARGVSPQLYGPAQLRWFAALDEDHPNLRAAVEWALGNGEPDVVADLQRALWLYVWCREDHVWGQAQVIRALHDPRLSASGRAVLMMTAGCLTRLFGDLETALPMLDEAVTLAEIGGLQDMEMLALMNRGLVLNLLGRAQAAERDLEACLRVAGHLGNPALESYAYSCLGDVLNRRGEHEVAGQLLRTALEKARSHAGGWYLYRAALIFANHLRDRGDAQEAQRHYRLCREQIGQFGRASDLAECLAEQGQAFYDAGERAQALEALQESQRLMLAQNGVETQVAGLGLRVLGQLALDEGQLILGADHLLRAMRTFQRAAASEQLISLLPGFVHLFWLQGRAALSAELLERFGALSRGLVPSVPLAARLEELRTTLRAQTELGVRPTHGGGHPGLPPTTRALDEVLEFCRVNARDRATHGPLTPSH